jgi:flagellar biosynthesis/type III secretory pathway protein FliH
MSGFCTRKIAIDTRLRPRDGVIRMQDLELTSDARALADDILAQARAEAERIREQAEQDARECAREAEAETLRRAAALLATLEQANATLVERARGVVIETVQGLYERLAAQTTPRKRIEASLARILREAPPRLVEPVLRVHPDDVGLLPEVEWEVRRDASLARGACRLEAATGQWQADFDASVEALRLAFAAATQGPTQPDA